MSDQPEVQLLQDELDLVPPVPPTTPEDDEPDFAALRRRRAENREEKVRTSLAGDHVAAVYRRLILRTSLLTAVECRYLCLLIERGHRLTNIFPSRTYIRRRLPTEGKKQKKTLARLDQIRRSCEAKGFLRRWSLTAEVLDHDEVIEVESGRFISAVGYQLLLPAGVIGPHADGWEGPVDWSNRLYAKGPRQGKRGFRGA